MHMLPDGRRLHLHDGPIDLIVEAYGRREQIHAAYDSAARRFLTILDELCSELPLLRQAVRGNVTPPQGVIARRMAGAVEPYAERCFITPMAAVAGAVAEEILETMTKENRTRALLCKQRRRHRTVSNSGRVVLRGYGRPARSPFVVRQASYSLRGFYTWPGNQRVAREKFFARHRRRGHGPGGGRTGCGCRGYDHR